MSSITGAPCCVCVGISAPFRKTPSVCVSSRQLRCVIFRPSGRNHQTSGRARAQPLLAGEEVGAVEDGMLGRSLISRRVNSSSRSARPSSSQSIQEIALSWQ